MTKRMLIDASHAEETRVVVLDGNRLEEFDLESANRKPLKGNIYLAKVVRVEPSLQAAFVEYGGNRHGFLAFGEIHPDYYQLPVADRQRLLEMQAAEAREEEEEEERQAAAAARAASSGHGRRGRSGRDGGRASIEAAAASAEESAGAAEILAAEEAHLASGDDAGGTDLPAGTVASFEAAEGVAVTPAAEDGRPPSAEAPSAETPAAAAEDPAHDQDSLPTAAPMEAEATAGPADPAPYATAEPVPAEAEGEPVPSRFHAAPNGHAEDGFPGSLDSGALDSASVTDADDEEDEEEEAPPETLGGADEPAEDMARERRIPPRFLRHYKIQEVIKRRQIMLVQVVKEERGTKGAALTTYVSLAGRFSVLMPNSPRGGGVSRKITSATDRKRLREAIDELGLPQGMSLIVRTAGAQRPKPEIKRDCEYLLRLWDNIRERTLASTAPALIYEEADLIKRSIRDVFSREVEEILVEGEDAFQEAREFMRMLMPQHVRKIQLVREGGLFARGQVEQQLEAIHSPVVQLRSGGYIVINQTEALVAIDVNSGRATRDRHIEDTALRTNCEAADEIARQLRLRDLAGLIVIDFIDMESGKHDAMVERRLKEALRFDRARIQVGRISHFGLLEMSRQRLRPSLGETAFVVCPHCQGRGTVRSVESSALMVLRAVEDEAARRRAAELTVHVASPVALYLLNRKRDRLAQIEARFGVAVLFEPDDALTGAGHRIERTRAADPSRPLADTPPQALRMDYAPEPEVEDEEEDAASAEAEEEEEEAAPASRGAATAARNGEADSEDGKAGDGGKRRRRRRRRRGGPRTEGGAAGEGTGAEGEDEDEEEGASAAGGGGDAEGQAAEDRALPPAAGEDAAVAEEGTPADDAGVFAEEGGPAGDGGPRRRRRRSRGGRGPRAEAAGGEAPVTPEAPAAMPITAAPPPVPRYVGPTPADPFAGQVDDIYAAMEAAEAALEAAAAAARSAPPRAAPPLAEPPLAEPPVAAPPAPEPVVPQLVASEPVVAEAVAVDPVAAPAVPPPEAAAAEPVAAEPPPATSEPVLPTEAPVVPAEVAPPPAAAAEVPAGSPVPVAAVAETPAPVEAPTPAAAEPVPAPRAEEPVQGAPVQPKVIGEAPIEAPRRSGWWRR